MVWNESQQITLAIVPKFTSFLSLLGSSWVILEVLTEQEKRRSVYHRLLCAMSIYDVLESIWNFASTWPIPAGTTGIWAASGTRQTCSAQGFFLQLGLAIPMYNASLSIYYLLVIRYNMQDTKLKRRVEPCMHIFSFLFAGGTAFASIGLGLYNNANLWCWLAPLPLGCLDSWRYGDEGDCIRGDNAWIYRWAFYFAPLWFCLVLSTVTMMFISKTVRAREEATVGFRHPTIGRLSAVETTTTSVSQETSEQIVLHKNESFLGSDYLHNDNNTANEAQEEPSTENKTKWQSISQQSKASASNVVGAYRNWKERKALYQQENPKSTQVFHQALYYLGAFYMTHLFSTVNRILEQTRGESYFPLVVLHSFFDPLQGFLNFLVYRRPRYLRYRKQNKTRTEALKETLRWSSCLDGVDNESRPKLQWPKKLVGSKKSASQQHSIKSEASSHSSSMERRRSGMLLIAQQSLQKVEEDEENDDANRMETVPEIEGVDSDSH